MAALISWPCRRSSRRCRRCRLRLLRGHQSPSRLPVRPRQCFPRPRSFPRRRRALRCLWCPHRRWYRRHLRSRAAGRARAARRARATRRSRATCRACATGGAARAGRARAARRPARPATLFAAAIRKERSPDRAQAGDEEMLPRERQAFGRDFSWGLRWRSLVRKDWKNRCPFSALPSRSFRRAGRSHGRGKPRGATGIPCASASRIRSAVFDTASFRFMLVRWVSTVFRQMKSRFAMSLDAYPATTCRKISCSRRDRDDNPQSLIRAQFLRARLLRRRWGGDRGRDVLPARRHRPKRVKESPGSIGT